MGCTASQISESQSNNPMKILKQKPVVWFINGGPGSNKGKITQYLVRDYKFKYLSVYDILRFQKDSNNSVYSEIIKQLILQKKNFPTDLILRLIKKAISAFGVRRFLVDGFPRNMEDIQQFEKIFTNREIEFKMFINIEVSDQRMRQSGLQAKKEDKRSKEEVQKEINEIIRTYRKQTGEIIKYFYMKNKLLQVNGNNSQDQAYRDIRLRFDELGVKNIQQGDTKIFFGYFDDNEIEKKYICRMRREYGFYCYNVRTLIQQIKEKNNVEGKMIEQCEKNNRPIPREFFEEILRRKIERKNYHGNFLIRGYPRTIEQAEEWSKTFGWEAEVYGFIGQINTISQGKQKTENGRNQEQNKKHEGERKQLKLLCGYYEKQKKLCSIQANNIINFGSIEIFLSSQSIKKRTKLTNRNIVFVSTINHKVTNITNETTQQKWKLLNMNYLYEAEVKQQSIYSELIHSFLSAGKPLPGQISIKCLLRNIQNLPDSENLIIKGFPNSLQQFQTWQQQIGTNYPACKMIYFELNEVNILSMLNQKKLPNVQQTIKMIQKNYIELQNYLKSSDIKVLKVKESINNQQISKFIN